MKERIIGDARARAELQERGQRAGAAMEPLRKQMRLTELQALKRDLERNARVTKLLQDCHKRIAGSPVVWGDRDLLQRITEEVMEAQR